MDLYAIGFNPVFRDLDTPGWVDDSVPDDVLGYWNVKASLLEQLWNLLRRWLHWGSHYPGIKQVEHVYFYAVHGADEATRRSYLDRAYALGREF